MHTSLKLQTNLIVILVCLLVAGAFSIMTQPFPGITLLISAIFGIAAGIMQSRSITLVPDGFRNAQTAMGVRRVLTSTLPGKRAIQIQWVLLPFLFASAIWIGNPQGAAVAGFATFMCVRDLVALKAVIGLSQGNNMAE